MEPPILEVAALERDPVTQRLARTSRVQIGGYIARRVMTRRKRHRPKVLGINKPEKYIKEEEIPLFLPPPIPA